MANKKISELASLTTAVGTEELVVNSSGTSKKITVSDLHTNMVITGTVDGRDLATDGSKLDGIEASANNYSHPSGDGSLHVPATSTTNDGKVLTAGATAGSLTWETPVDNNTTYVSSDFDHDALTNFVADEHIDWSLTNVKNIHSDNYTNTTYSVGDGGLSEINFTSADHSKLDGIEDLADVTDTTNVTAAGALMDSEVTNLADVKAFATTDYATAAQGTTADAALPKAGGAMTGVITIKGITETQTTKSASFTPVFTEGTTYSCTSAMTITMPTATAGKSFTIIHATGTSITWAGATLKWSDGTEPTKGAGIDIYTFISDGTSWYGMQGGTDFA